MMRWVIFSVAVVAVAAIATVASTYIALSRPDEIVPTARDVPSGPTGSIVVDGPLVHEFGVMSQWTEGKHEWSMTNKGPGVVKLSLGQPSCSCTIAELKDGKTATLAEGESTKVTLNWNTKSFHDHYRQMAPVLISNDPANQKIEFAVEGNVQPAVQTMPATAAIDFLTVSNDGGASREIAFFSKDRPDLKITAPETSDSSLFDTKVVDLTPQERAMVKAEKGKKLIISVKPGASLGNFNEEIVVGTDHPNKPKVEVRVTGKLVGPITITPERVRMLDVSAKAGGSQSLVMWVRGRKETKFTVEKKPKDVEVEITPMADAGATNSAKYKVTVKIAPGMTTGRTIADEIILKTDYPQASEVKIPVAVLVHAG